MAIFPLNRRKFIRLAATAGIATIAANAVLIEPNRPQVVRRDIALVRWPASLDGFTVALLSDFHYDPYFSVHPLNAAVDLVNELHPELIVLTGDFVSVPLFGNPAKGASAAEPCAQVLKKLRARHGLWAVMGNHDVFTDASIVTSALRAEGIQVLTNQSVAIEANGGRFWLCGVGDVLGGTANLDTTLQHVSPREATVLLVHEPDYADFVAHYPVDLQLSGHTHGGQVRVPFLPPLYLPAMAKKYVWGFYKIGNLMLYTNAGLGTVGIPARFHCPPEITLLTLRAAL